MKNKNDTKNQKKSIKSGILWIIGLIILVAIGDVLSQDYGSAGTLMGISLGVAALWIYLLISDIKKQNKKDLAYYFVFAIIYVLIIVGVFNDQPSFIREIQGEDFVGIWMAVLVCLMLAAEIVIAAIYYLSLKSKVNEAKGKVYSDDDLMLLRKFDRYKLCGYYLLKARVHNIIKYSVEEVEPGNVKIEYVDINSTIDENELNAYCDANPQVKKIVAFIKSVKTSEDVKVRVLDVVAGVEPTPCVQSSGGVYSTKQIQKVEKVASVIRGVAICCGYAFGIIKLFMGIYNEKAVSDLVGGMFGAIFLLSLVVGIGMWLHEMVVNKVFVEKILKEKSRDFKNIGNLFSQTELVNSSYSKEEATRLLRAYSIYEYKSNNYSANTANINSADNIFAAVVMAPALVSRNAPDTGCSSCGSCSGCSSCSSCGGCGGCGD